MALGGFKFAGFKCTKPGDATDAQWALLIHKTRLKAFLAANTLAGNVWVQDWNGGTIDFNSGDGMIYDLSSDGLNLVSFFKHNSEEKYYMIASLFKWSPGDYTDTYKVSTAAVQWAYFSGSTNNTRVYGKQLFHTVSYDRFTPDCLSYSINSYPSRALTLVPIGGWRAHSSYQNFAVTINEANSFGSKTSLYLGYALRGKDIISFATYDLTLANAQNYMKATLVGFDSLNLSSPNDTANIYGICLDVNNTDTVYSAWSSSGGALTYCQDTLKSDFTRYPQADKWSTLFLASTHSALYGGTPDSVPYEAAILMAGSARTSAPYLNDDGITSKGTFNIEVLASNSMDYNNISKMSTCANGNYLVAAFFAGNPQTSIVPQTTYYVGWDPSNPSLLQDASWTAYDGT